MSKTTKFGTEVTIVKGVEYHVWRDLNTFITWGHLMSTDDIRYTESNVIAYKDMRFSLMYKDRKIVIDPVDDADVPPRLVNILKQVADSAVKENDFLPKH